MLEPLETLERRTKEWQELARRVRDSLVQLQRNESFESDAESLSSLMGRAAEAAVANEDALRRRLLRCARLVSTDAPVLLRAEEYGTRFPLPLPDAVMLASFVLLAEVEPGPSLFVNTNRKDFGDVDVVALLHATGTEVIWSFRGAVSRLKANSPLAPH